jgi:putative peptide zinc metalloprotease protein
VTAGARLVPPRTERGLPAPDTGGPGEAPRLADGVELLGEYKDSGYSQPVSLVRRGDGQVIQMSGLLYLVASRIDGSRTPEAIAESVSDDLGRSLSPDQVRYLITGKLMPLGVVTSDGGPAALPKANPLLALRARATLLPERAANATGLALRPLFRWPVVVAVGASVAGLDYWLFAVHGLGAGLRQVLLDPADLLIVVALSVISAAFHECGHAAACRYGGAKPGRIGVGIYLVWPSFFTNVTDSYRLSRGGRLRTDLGGLYFNLIYILILAGLYTATSSQILLLVIAVTHLEMLEQLLPFVRFDGYFILSDLAGVPDLFARVVPILKGALPWSRTDPRLGGLRRGARNLVISWVACAIPLLTLTVGYLLMRLPAINRALWDSAHREAHLTATAVGSHDYAAGAVDALGVGLAALSVAGSLYVITGLARRAAVGGMRWSGGHAGRRVLLALAAVVCVSLLAAFWVADGQFRGW